MRKINSNLFTWVVSSLGLLSVVFSIILILPGIVKATDISVPCKDGTTIKCSGYGCVGSDNSYCGCNAYGGGRDEKSCPKKASLEEEAPVN